jgi:hypothetical protein
VGGVIALLFIWWFLAVGLQQMVKSASLTTTTVASPAVGITFSCPAPGADRWSNKYIGPPTMTGLWPAVELMVTTASTTNASSASTQTVVTPAAPC